MIRYQPAGSICPTFEAAARLLGCAKLASVARPFAPDKAASILGWRRDPAKLQQQTPVPPHDIAKPLASCRSGTQRKMIAEVRVESSLGSKVGSSRVESSLAGKGHGRRLGPSFLLSKNIDKDGLRRYKGPSFIPGLL